MASGVGDEVECVKEFRSILNRTHVDIQLLGIGEDGHIAFNEPGQVLHNNAHIEALTESTIAANARFFADADAVPKKAISMWVWATLCALPRSSSLPPAQKGRRHPGPHHERKRGCEQSLHHAEDAPDVTVIIDRPLADLVGYTD